MWSEEIESILMGLVKIIHLHYLSLEIKVQTKCTNGQLQVIKE